MKDVERNNYDKPTSEIVDSIEDNYQDTGFPTEENTQTEEENVEEQEENVEEQEETYNPNQNNQQEPSYEEDIQTQDQSDVLFEVTEIAAGEECTNGGQLVEAGVDSNENGVLDQHEITNSEYICDDENQSNSQNQSENSSIILSTQQVQSGGDCEHGGYVVLHGYDVNNNSNLDPEEIIDEEYLCNDTPEESNEQIEEEIIEEEIIEEEIIEEEIIEAEIIEEEEFEQQIIEEETVIVTEEEVLEEIEDTDDAIYITSTWFGDLQLGADGLYTGVEGYDFNNGTMPFDSYNCQLLWDLLASDTTFSTGCTNCIFQVVALAEPQQTSVTNDGTCDSMFHPAAFGYAIDNQVPGYEGIDVLMYSTGTVDPDGNVLLNEFVPWFYNMTSTELATSYNQNTVSYDSTNGTFSYTQGFRNYEYTYYQ